MENTNKLVYVGVAFAVVFSMVAMFSVNDGRDGSDGRDGKDGAGGFAGPIVTTPVYFRLGAVKGGAIVSTSTANTSATLLATDLIRRTGYTTWLKVTPTGGNLTLTFPASSTLAHYAPNAGDEFILNVENAATAATTTTIAAGTGMDLQEPDGQNVVIGQNNYAVMTFRRDCNSDFVVTVDETIPAD